ncbi:MAG: PQQ-binding-like beta-propeller repeat protein [bacterium]|nr:PQQ-binding-like beta-propeller repeat protein [bacterium]
MRTTLVILAGASIIWAVAAAAESAPDGERFWPQWRGPEATGVSPDGDPPTRWSETENVRWKIEIPGTGYASPIVWGDRIFVLTAIAPDQGAPPQEQEAPPSGERRWPPTVAPDAMQQFAILAIARDDGRVLWQRTAVEAKPHEGIHSDASWASSSPVTDGVNVYAFFGSRGLFCYDFDGRLRWHKDLGDMTTRHAFGEGSSPALHGETIVVNWDHEGDSFIVALDKRNGAERWKVARDEVTSWSTPIVVDHAGGPQVIVAATDRTRGYDLGTGKAIWEAGGMTMNVIPTPIYAHGMVYVTSGFRGNALQAIRLAAAQGEVTGSEAVVWSHERHTPYVPSPVVYGDKLYFLKTNSGILSCLNALTGEVHYTEKRLPGIDGVYASLVGAGGRIYVAGKNGTTAVVRHAEQFEVLAENTFDDAFNASPAIVGGELYLRGRKHLYCIAQEQPGASGSSKAGKERR